MTTTCAMTPSPCATLFIKQSKNVLRLSDTFVFSLLVCVNIYQATDITSTATASVIQVFARVLKNRFQQHTVVPSSDGPRR